jgi:hypothetical protein
MPGSLRHRGSPAFPNVANHRYTEHAGHGRVGHPRRHGPGRQFSRASGPRGPTTVPTAPMPRECAEIHTRTHPCVKAPEPLARCLSGVAQPGSLVRKGGPGLAARRHWPRVEVRSRNRRPTQSRIESRGKAPRPFRSPRVVPSLRAGAAPSSAGRAASATSLSLAGDPPAMSTIGSVTEIDSDH